jgi:hypothetical protein
MGLDADGLNHVQAARIRRTRFFKNNKEAFIDQLVSEIRKHIKIANKNSLIPCVRLNGTSDLPYENIKIGKTFANIFDFFPDVQFYDYTKVPVRLRSKALDIPNYHLSFSLSENNTEKAKEAANAGMNVVVVFARKKKDPLPDKFWQKRVIDGDVSDLRFLDPKGVIVGLRSKGRGKQDKSGFVQA